MPRDLAASVCPSLHRLDAGAHDLRHVGAFVDGQSEDRDPEGGKLARDVRIVEELRHPVVPEEELDQERRTAKEPHVEVGRTADQRVLGHAHESGDHPQEDAEHLGYYRHDDRALCPLQNDRVEEESPDDVGVKVDGWKGDMAWQSPPLGICLRFSLMVARLAEAPVASD